MPDPIPSCTQVLRSFCCAHCFVNSDRLNKKSTSLIGKHMEAVLGESMNKRKQRASKQTAVATALVSMGDYATVCVAA